MDTRYGFLLMTGDEFLVWLDNETISRRISIIQNHHTFLPDYTHFNGKNHFERLKAMKDYHVANNGWSDIAQNITTFPDGTLAICRPIQAIPAGIKGQNSMGICIEHFGNFDNGKDQMAEAHRQSILRLNAALCKKFQLIPSTNTIVYHHWYDLITGKRENGKGTTKSCPGSAFFGGNSVEAAETNFIPAVKESLAILTGNIALLPAVDERPLRYCMVNYSQLYVRKGSGTAYDIKSVVYYGSILPVYAKSNGWIKIDPESGWISGRYTRIIGRSKVIASSLNVRSGPGMSHHVTGTLKANELVYIYETSGEWVRIDLTDKWVSRTHLINVTE